MKNISVAIKLALKNLAGNKARTFFSLLGVIIGVMLVIVVLSLGAGMKEYITNQLESFGTDIIEVEIKTPGKSAVSAGNMGGIATGISITTFKLHEAERIAGLEGIGPWYAGLMHQDVISYKEENQSAMIMGVTARVKEVDQKFGIAAGEMFTDEDDKNLKNFIIMGSKIAKDFFGSEKEAVGKRVKMGNQRFMVKGVLQERGGAGFFDFDELIYMPAQTLQKKVLGADHIQFAMFKYKDEEQEDLLVENINAILKEEHNINSPDEQDFAVISMSEAADIIDDVFRVLNFLLIGLTSISLIVGGVGIMNVMYVAVTERTFEIGLRKSLGAKEGDILKQFLFEALFLTLFGGVLGILAGFIFTKLAELAALRFDFFLTFPVTPFSILLALGFSIIVGVVFGYKPAKKAAKLSPMEAMRDE